MNFKKALYFELYINQSVREREREEERVSEIRIKY